MGDNKNSCITALTARLDTCANLFVPSEKCGELLDVFKKALKCDEQDFVTLAKLNRNALAAPVIGPPRPAHSTTRRLAHLDQYQHASPVPLTLFAMIFFIVGVVLLRYARNSTEPSTRTVKKRCRKAPANDAKPRNL